MIEEELIWKRLDELSELDEASFMADFHQMVKKKRKEAWHDKHINMKSFMVGGHVLLYDNKFLKFPWKLQMHWFGPFIVADVKELGVVKIVELHNVFLPRWVNGAHLKPFQGSNNVTQNWLHL